MSDFILGMIVGGVIGAIAAALFCIYIIFPMAFIALQDPAALRRLMDEAHERAARRAGR